MPFVTLISLLIPALASAAPADELIARLIREAWAQGDIRVEWHGSAKAPAALADHDDWVLAEPRPRRLAGSLILTLERTDISGSTQRVVVSGTARVFGPGCTPTRLIAAGEPVTTAELRVVETEWTNLSGELVDLNALGSGYRAAHALVPGRPLIARDLKPIPLIKRGQNVKLSFEHGAVRVLLQGRALQDGAAGDVIAVAVQFERSRRLKGRVEPSGQLSLVQ